MPTAGTRRARKGYRERAAAAGTLSRDTHRPAERKQAPRKKTPGGRLQYHLCVGETDRPAKVVEARVVYAFAVQLPGREKCNLIVFDAYR